MKVKLLIASALASTAIAVPIAQAGGGAVSSLGYEPAGGPGAAGPVLPAGYEGRELVGGPGAGGPVLRDWPSTYLGYEPAGGPGAAGPVLPAGYDGRELVGGPGGAGPVVAFDTQATADGFDWADALVGGAFAAGIALLTAGAALIARRRRVLAHLHL